MHAKRMIAVVVAAVGFAASGAYASTNALPELFTTAQEEANPLAGVQLAREAESRGRGRGRDDVRADDRRGRGRDDAQADDRRGKRNKADDRRGSGRKKDRVPGGSGCDDLEDIAEHPACV